MSGEEDTLAAQVRAAAQRQDEIELGEEVLRFFQGRAGKKVLTALEERYMAAMVRAKNGDERDEPWFKLRALKDLLKELKVIADRGFAAARQGAAGAEQPEQPLTKSE